MVSNSEKYSRFAVMCKIGSQKCLDKTVRWFMYWFEGSVTDWNLVHLEILESGTLP